MSSFTQSGDNYGAHGRLGISGPSSNLNRSEKPFDVSREGREDTRTLGTFA